MTADIPLPIVKIIFSVAFEKNLLLTKQKYFKNLRKAIRFRPKINFLAIVFQVRVPFYWSKPKICPTWYTQQKWSSFEIFLLLTLVEVRWNLLKNAFYNCCLEILVKFGKWPHRLKLRMSDLQGQLNLEIHFTRSMTFELCWCFCINSNIPQKLVVSKQFHLKKV